MILASQETSDVCTVSRARRLAPRAHVGRDRRWHRRRLFACLGPEQNFAFGLWGDMPYAKAKDGPKIPALIADMNKSDIAFSLYDGDIKDGSSKCTDDAFDDAIKMFGEFKKPVVYVPGDNEWTDCHRMNNGGYDNLERLAYLRKTMFANGGVFGAENCRVDHQGKPGESSWRISASRATA